MATTYLTRAQTTARIAQRLYATDQSLIAWNALSDADKDVAMDKAQSAVDAVRWRGRVVETDQETMWPRLDMVRTGGTVNGVDAVLVTNRYIDADTTDADCNVAGIPRAVKDAFAIQCAHEALSAAGLNVNAHVRDAAHAGIASQATTGESLSLDLKRANAAVSGLCAEAARRVAHLRVAGGWVG